MTVIGYRCFSLFHSFFLSFILSFFLSFFLPCLVCLSPRWFALYGPSKARSSVSIAKIQTFQDKELVVPVLSGDNLLASSRHCHGHSIYIGRWLITILLSLRRRKCWYLSFKDPRREVLVILSKLFSSFCCRKAVCQTSYWSGSVSRSSDPPTVETSASSSGRTNE